MHLQEQSNNGDDERQDQDNIPISGGQQQQQRRCVQFDPRVTVTEFNDHYPRFWFSENELERLKYETVNTVRKYLLQHLTLNTFRTKPADVILADGRLNKKITTASQQHHHVATKSLDDAYFLRHEEL